jgi:4-amino-4-deoxychorismate lyase
MPAQGSLRDGTTANFDLIETLRWQPDEGFVRLDRHLQRLYSSAAALGFAADPEAVGAALGKCGGDTSLRVRLALSRDGTTEVTATPFEPLAKDAVWTLRIAQARLDSADFLLRHKTTRRQAYEAARAEFSRERADEVLLLNERGEVCEGTITNLFISVGGPVLVTPPLTSGLLAGVLRGSMLEVGAAREAVVTEADLRAAQTIFVGNSLRGLVRGRLA